MISFSKVYTVNRQTTLSRIVCSLRNNKICPSQGNGKKIIYFLYNSSCGDDTLFSGFISDYAYERKLCNNFHCLHQKPPQLMRVKKLSVTGEQKLLKITAIVSAHRPILTFKNDIWH